MMRNLGAFRVALRRLAKYPGFTALAVAALALGLGMTIYGYGAVNSIYFRGLPFPEPQELVHLEVRNAATGEQRGVWPLDYLDWRQQESFQDLGAIERGSFNVSGDQLPQRYSGAAMTANVFEMLGAVPLLGRTLVASDDLQGAEPVVLLGHDLWQQRYGGEEGIVGRSVRLNGVATTVAGVMPRGFKFPVADDLWVPLKLDVSQFERGAGPYLQIFGRLRDGLTVEEAQAEMTTIAERFQQDFPESHKNLGVGVEPYVQQFVGDPAVLYVVLAAVGFVLLIACANVANMLLARASQRSTELAIRSALGARRAGLILQMMAESLLLSLGGAVIGSLLAWKALDITHGLYAGLEWTPFWWNFSIDGRVVVMAVVAAILASLLAGLIPALRASGLDMSAVLHEGGRGSTSLKMSRLSRMLVIGEIALSCVLLICAGLMMRSINNLVHLDIGGATEGFLSGTVTLSEATYPDKPARVRFHEQLEERLRSTPGILAVSVASSMPGSQVDASFYTLEGVEVVDKSTRPAAYHNIVSPSYFDTFDVPLLAGRAFDSRDRADGQPVAIISQLFAEKVWPDADPLGERIRLAVDEGELENPWRTVVGVVPNVAHNLFVRAPREMVYVPLAQTGPATLRIGVRGTGEPMSLATTLSEQVAATDPDIPAYNVKPLTDLIQADRAAFVFIGKVFSVFGLIAIVLASAGIYGVTAFSVSQRSQEIGVRRAFGADDGAILRLVLGQGVRRLVIGLIPGLILAFLISSLLSSSLFGLESTDFLSFFAAVALLTAVVLLACYFPARRALRVHAVRVLRYE
ncbi:MAG TPA: ABC transporter permease [Thermoanaerobaculia bacterium]